MSPLRIAVLAVMIYGIAASYESDHADEWEESTILSSGVHDRYTSKTASCDDAALKARYESAREPEQAGEKCTLKSLCHAMQMMDEAWQRKDAKKRRPTPCVASDGANCQRSYYSAYKCKALLVSGDQTAKRNGGTGKMCTANSPGKIVYTPTACGRVLKKSRGSVAHGQLFDWITNRAGPLIWSNAGVQSGALCSVTRRSKAKYAIADCDSLPDFNEDPFEPNMSDKGNGFIPDDPMGR